MFDHVSLKVRDFQKSLSFYRAALTPLGIDAQVDEPGRSAGFGSQADIGLWLAEGEPSSPVHLAFKARSRDQVVSFHQAALRAGGADNGKPGLRLDYAKDYYAAFVTDPDGNNIEAVAHELATLTKPVYYIGCYDIDDADTFRRYPPVVLELLPKYGGQLLASDTNGYVVEGTARTMNAIIRFPSREAALGLYEDPAYQEAKRLRQGATSNVTMVLVEALG